MLCAPRAALRAPRWTTVRTALCSTHQVPQETLCLTVDCVMLEGGKKQRTVLRTRDTEGRLCTLVGDSGVLYGAREGATVEVTGAWEDDTDYGRQFHVKACAAPPTLSPAVVRAMLCGRGIKGVGPKTASALLDTLGEGLVTALDQGDEAALQRAPGVGRATAKRIAGSWRALRERGQAAAELEALGLAPAIAQRVEETLGAGALAAVMEDPYALLHRTRGLTWRGVDVVGRRLGVEPWDPRRVRGAFVHVLRAAAQTGGHCCLAEQDLLREVERVVGSVEEAAEAVVAAAGEGQCPAAMRRALDSLAADGTLRVWAGEGGDATPTWFLREVAEAEEDAAGRLVALAARGSHPLRGLAFPAPVVERAIRSVLRRAAAGAQALRLTEEQIHAVWMAAASPVSVLTGGPGVGKTTTVRLITETWRELGLGEIALAAPTARAAKTLGHAVGGTQDGTTLHRLLGFSPRGRAAAGSSGGGARGGSGPGAFAYRPDDPLPHDAVVVDEVSMVDLPLARALLRALPLHGQLRVLFVGDPDQLPPVGPGAVLRDLLESDTAPVTKLTRVFRQAQASDIVVNAHAVLGGSPSLRMAHLELTDDGATQWPAGIPRPERTRPHGRASDTPAAVEGMAERFPPDDAPPEAETAAPTAAAAVAGLAAGALRDSPDAVDRSGWSVRPEEVGLFDLWTTEDVSRAALPDARGMILEQHVVAAAGAEGGDVSTTDESSAESVEGGKEGDTGSSDADASPRSSLPPSLDPDAPALLAPVMCSSATWPEVRDTLVSEFGEGGVEAASGGGPLIDAGAPAGDVAFLEVAHAEDIVGAIAGPVVDAVVALGYDPLRDVQVLSPITRGPLGTATLNEALQRRFARARGDPTPDSPGVPVIGDRVMQLVNSYDKGVFNGELGMMQPPTASSPGQAAKPFRRRRAQGGAQSESKASVLFGERSVTYTEREFRTNLGLAYAITVHKAQGSEFPVVILPIHRSTAFAMSRSLLYTAITRARSLLVLVGERSAVGMAVRRREDGGRATALTERLRAHAAR